MFGRGEFDGREGDLRLRLVLLVLVLVRILGLAWLWLRSGGGAGWTLGIWVRRLLGSEFRNPDRSPNGSQGFQF